MWLPLWNRKTKELTFVEHVFCARYWAGGRPTVSDVILKTEAQRHLNKLFRLIYLFADLRFRLCLYIAKASVLSKYHDACDNKIVFIFILPKNLGTFDH